MPFQRPKPWHPRHHAIRSSSAMAYTGWPKSASVLKMLSKNFLINLLRKFQLRLQSWSITINTQINFRIISQYRISCETCPTLVQNATLWNNAPTWLNNIFETVRTKLHSGASKRGLRRCQTLKRSNGLLKDSKLLTRSKMYRDWEDRIIDNIVIILYYRLPTRLVFWYSRSSSYSWHWHLLVLAIL